MIRGTISLVVACVFFVTMMQARVAEQRTIWSGVYAEGQVAKGEAIFEETCIGCHGGGLEGNPTFGAPPLRGNKFMESWREDNLNSLFTKIVTTMPLASAAGGDFGRRPPPCAVAS